VDEEIARLRDAWRRDGAASAGLVDELLASRAADVDPFERVQLEEVLRVCRSARSLSEAGRTLFAVSRTKKSSSNDADRLRKYLARYGLAWKDVTAGNES
jgi:transcriptional regulatory protein RtcR